MRILITGFTGVQTNTGGSQLEMISNLRSLVEGLKMAGHDVDWRYVCPGEDLSVYEKIIVSINGTGSWVSPFALGALYAMGSRPDALLTCDDWQIHKAFTSSVEKELGTLWNPKLGRHFHAEAIGDESIKKAIDSAVEELCYIHHRKMLVPSFMRGDLSLLGLGAPNAVKYDPSPFMDIYEYNPLADKAKMWVSAGLAPKDSWFKKQPFSWEVEFYGIRKLGQPRVKEAMLAQIYSERWGVISPPHPHAGSGWFRVRFYMAAQAGCVVYCSDAEGKVIGESYRKTLDVIEAMSEKELAELAAKQKEELESNLWSKETLSNFLDNFIRT